MTKKLLIACVVIINLVGCGNGVYVELHHVSTERLASICGDCNGYAKWDEATNECDIYMMHKEEYSSINIYHDVLGHELRHCFEGNWHD